MCVNFATFLGGLGLLLYGMQLLSGGLCRLAGADRPDRPVFTRLHRTGPAGCAVAGALITAVAESSSAVTLFAMSAADAGLLTVRQAVALCWGANLGTTATGQLLKLAGGTTLLSPALLCPLCCFAGAGAILFGRGRLRIAGEAGLGLGLTFTGLNSLQTVFLPALRGAGADRLQTWLQHPLPAFGAGVLLAALLQSSSAAVALIQAAAAGGTLPWAAAAPLVMGTDLGTCSTALLAALGFGKEKPAARQVAAGHLLFNLIGCGGGAVCGFCVRNAAFWRQAAGFGGVADFQLLFNAATLLVLLPALYCCRSVGGSSFCRKIPLYGPSTQKPTGR